jgi:ABC-type sugar transport system ATPase subunit
LIVELSVTGSGALMTSSELEEVIGVSDRIVFMRDGAACGGIARDQASFGTVAAGQT